LVVGGGDNSYQRIFHGFAVGSGLL